MVSNVMKIAKYLLVCLVFVFYGNVLNAVTFVQPKIVTDGSNNQNAIWVSVLPTGSVIQSSFKPNSGVFGSPITISGPFSFQSNLQVDEDNATGHIAVVWIGLDSENQVFSLYSNFWNPDEQVWRTPVQISPVGQNVRGFFAIKINLNVVTVVWNAYSGPDLLLFTNSGIEGVWGTAVQLPSS